MNLIIDIGNSLAKLAIFDGGKLTASSTVQSLTKKYLIDFLFRYPKVRKVIMSSVSKHNPETSRFLTDNFSSFIELSGTTRLPFKVLYASRKTLGNDRVAGIAGAYNIYPGYDVLVIDSGTAITYDVLTKKGEFTGGNISPGLNMRYKALNNFTANLPLLEKTDEFRFTGNDTASAITCGVQNGIIFEMERYIEQFMNLYQSDRVILTGGDCIFFGKNLKNPIFVEPNLVFIGLNSILSYNE